MGGKSPSPIVPYAIRALELSFPPGEYTYAEEEPTVKVPRRLAYPSGNFSDHDMSDVALTPDVAIYKDGKLIAVVEVGSLSLPHKLQLLEQALPGVAVYWIPKVDLMPALAPDMMRFRLLMTRDGDDTVPVQALKAIGEAARLNAVRKTAVKLWGEMDSVLQTLQTFSKSLGRVRKDLAQLRQIYESQEYGELGVPMRQLDDTEAIGDKP